MKLAHNIAMSVFGDESDLQENLEKVFHSLLPVDFEKEKITLSKNNAEGVQNKKIVILELIIKKDRHIKEFLKNLNNLLTKDQKELLIKQSDSRLDNSLHFFLRLDKDKLLNNEPLLTDKGNCFHIKISLAVFPKKREKVLNILKDIFR